MKASYLVAYNTLMALAWQIVAVMVMHTWFTSGPSAVYTRAGLATRCLQWLSILESVHAGLGLVRSSPLTNFTQWLGRSHALFMITQPIPEMHTALGPALMLLAFSVGESSRYPWYAFSSAGGEVPYALTWLRYTAFIPVYPLGAASEMLSMVTALPYIRERSLFSFYMPNAYNWAFDYHTFVIIVLCVYPFAWLQLYLGVWKQRSRKIGPLLGRKAQSVGKDE